MGVALMKLSYIYMFIGISTLALNIVLTMDIIKKRKNMSYKEDWDREELITFRLSRGNSTYGDTTAAVSYDDTLPLE
jgi:hypothetical protein